jgi:putative ABC transport system permease protein
VLAFTLGISLLSALVFGLAPAVQTSKQELSELLKQGARRLAGRRRPRTGRFLVVSEVALAMVLLAGAGLMINSLLRLLRADLGFDPDNLVIMHVRLDEGPKYGKRFLSQDDVPRFRVTPRVVTFFEQLADRIARLPGVESVGMISSPSVGTGWATLFRIGGRPAAQPSVRKLREEARTAVEFPSGPDNPVASYDQISPGYFRTTRIPLRKGRHFTEWDRQGTPGVAIINETMARLFFPDQDPIGEVLHMAPVEDMSREVVGVVGDTRRDARADTGPHIYIPFRQHLADYPSQWGRWWHLRKSIVIRTNTEPTGVIAALQKMVPELRQEDVLSSELRIQTMESLRSKRAQPTRLFMWLLGSFAGLATFLAAVGLYGVISYSAACRMHEFGLRMALGAQRADVFRLVAKEGLILGLAGLAIGVAASLGLNRLMGSQLYGVTPTDPATFAAVSVLLVAVILLASYVPARRATKVDPMVALRCE